MNRTLFHLATLGCALLPTSLIGQQAETKTPPPEPPLVASPQPGSQWKLTVQFPQSAANAVHPVSASYRYTRDALWVGVAWSNGTSREGYVKDARVIFKNQTGYSSFAADEKDSGLPLFSAGFAGADWVARADYQGTETVESELCYRFLRPESTSPSGEHVPQRIAWIRVRDKTPSLVKLGEVTLHYSHPEKGADNLSVPPEVEALLVQSQRQQEGMRLLLEINRNAK
jgi:hypothetical protein